MINLTIIISLFCYYAHRALVSSKIAIANLILVVYLDLTDSKVLLLKFYLSGIPYISNEGIIMFDIFIDGWVLSFPFSQSKLLFNSNKSDIFKGDKILKMS